MPSLILSGENGQINMGKGFLAIGCLLSLAIAIYNRTLCGPHKFFSGEKRSLFLCVENLFSESMNMIDDRYLAERMRMVYGFTGRNQHE